MRQQGLVWANRLGLERLVLANWFGLERLLLDKHCCILVGIVQVVHFVFHGLVIRFLGPEVQWDILIVFVAIFLKIVRSNILRKSIGVNIHILIWFVSS